MSEAEIRYRRMLEAILDEAQLAPVIAAEIAEAKEKNRRQIFFSLYEAGLDSCLNIILNVPADPVRNSVQAVPKRVGLVLVPTSTRDNRWMLRAEYAK